MLAPEQIVYDYILPPKTGCVAFVSPGEILRITDLAGLQVVDMAVFKRSNPRDKLSTSYSRTRYKPKPGEKFVPRDKLAARRCPALHHLHAADEDHRRQRRARRRARRPSPHVQPRAL